MATEHSYGIHYREFHEPTREHAEKECDWTLEYLKPYLPLDTAIDVLDIGCGMGFALLAFQKFGYRTVVGVDIDDSQIAACKALDLNVEKITDLADYLSKHPGRFGLITLMDVLEHIPPSEQIDILQKVGGALKPNGRLIIKVPNASSIVAPRWQYIDFTHHTTYTEHSIKYAIRCAGFSVVDVPATENPEPRPSLNPSTLFTSGTWRQTRRWIVRRIWRAVLAVEFGDDYASKIPLGLNLLAIADKSVD